MLFYSITTLTVQKYSPSMPYLTHRATDALTLTVPKITRRQNHNTVHTHTHILMVIFQLYMV